MNSPRRFLGFVAFGFAILAAPFAFARAAGDWMSGFKMPELNESAITARTAKLTDFGAVAEGHLFSRAVGLGIPVVAEDGSGVAVIGDLG